MHVLIKRLDPGIPLPARAHPGDAGTDLFAAADVELSPGQRAVVPTGVAIALPDGYAAFVHPRSGLAARHGVTLVNAPGTVDAGYRGEIRVTLLNTDSSRPVRFQRGDRIAQLVIQRVERAVFHEVDTLPGSARGDGGFGSTGGHAATAGQAIGHENPATSVRQGKERAGCSDGAAGRTRLSPDLTMTLPRMIWIPRTARISPMTWQAPAARNRGDLIGGSADSGDARAAGRQARGTRRSASPSRSGWTSAACMIPVREGLEVQINMAEDQGVWIAVLRGENGLQLQAFAAPKTSGLWDEVRQEIADEVAKSGGDCEEAEGPFGTELHARVQNT